MNNRILAILLFIFFTGLSGLNGQNVSLVDNGIQDSLKIQAMAATDSLGIEATDIPNVFSPNGDDVNDYFEVDTPDDKVYYFRIFTRNGAQVYYSRSPRVFWDGRNSAGREVSKGIYYYVIESTDDPKGDGLSGFVYLYR